MHDKRFTPRPLAIFKTLPSFTVGYLPPGPKAFADRESLMRATGKRSMNRIRSSGCGNFVRMMAVHDDALPGKGRRRLMWLV
jgi:hypothetical protein